MADLYELINRYYKNKTECDALKKLVNEDNTEIKTLLQSMVKDNKASYEAGDVVANMSVIDKSDFDKDKLLKTLKSFWSDQNGSMTCPWTKYVEVVDMEAMEKALYNGELTPELIAPCKVEKFETRLTVKKVKKKDAD